MTQTIEIIVGQGLCMGCGLCKSLAGPGNVAMVMNAEGGERPVVTGTVDEPTLKLINAVCPASMSTAMSMRPGLSPRPTCRKSIRSGAPPG